MFGWQKKSEENMRKELNINEEQDTDTAINKTAPNIVDKKP